MKNNFKPLGFRSILNKSIRRESSTVRGTLLKLAYMCPENDIKSFIESQDDMKLLLNTMTPDTMNLLEDAFSDTIYTRIKRVPWDPKKKLVGFMSN